MVDLLTLLAICLFSLAWWPCGACPPLFDGCGCEVGQTYTQSLRVDITGTLSDGTLCMGVYPCSLVVASHVVGVEDDQDLLPCAGSTFVGGTTCDFGIPAVSNVFVRVDFDSSGPSNFTLTVTVTITSSLGTQTAIYSKTDLTRPADCDGFVDVVTPFVSVSASPYCTGWASLTVDVTSL
jgi:hypothetical protein